MLIAFDSSHPGKKMWHEDLPDDHRWSRLWSDYIACGCGGIRRVHQPCPACNSPAYDLSKGLEIIRLADGQEIEVSPTFAGAEGRYEDYIYLRMIEREWKRPVDDPDPFLGLPAESRPSPRAAIVLLFWTYFETRVERLLRVGARALPEPVADDLLRRYSFVTHRLDQLYPMLFGATYSADLAVAGYDDVWDHLTRVRQRRNDFAHGKPQAIDDALVESVVQMLKREHEAWIAVFNKRVAAIQTPARA
jgi:hypothetical protein